MPQLPSALALDALRAIGEETRLRIVVLLQHGELSVSDLTDILGQSQPRISRHLKLLVDAGVVDKHREGTWAFFDLVADGAISDLTSCVLARVDQHDPTLAADLDRLSIVRNRRATTAQEYFAGVAPRWDEERSLHAPDEVVETLIGELVGDTTGSSVLDIGTGTGRMLQLLAPNARLGVGLDNSHSMLAVARANLERAEIRNIELRQGDIYSPPFDRQAFDLVVVHQVLHFLDDPARAVREAAQLVAPGGRLLIVDFAPHALEFLRTEHSHRRLGFRADTVQTMLANAGLDPAPVHTIAAPAEAGPGERLTVSLWLAQRPAVSTVTPETSDERSERS
jgi:ubiquinone/menaquinone biosynthesis C-methylase UbiE/DNA-binding transcriptional ArsR family regulator